MTEKLDAAVAKRAENFEGAPPEARAFIAADLAGFRAGWIAALQEVRLGGDRSVGELLLEQLGEPVGGTE
jgi:hypothetical protein